MFLFGWDNVPGKDNGKLIEYLEQKYGVDWVRTAKIEKINNNEIRIATEKNFLSLKLNNENTKVTLTINKVTTDEFIVKTENSKLNIYKDIEQEKKDIRQGVKVKEISYPYSLLGGLVLAGLIVVALMGYYGTQSAGIFSPREAFFVIGASILILSAASVYLFLTLRDRRGVSPRLKAHAPARPPHWHLASPPWNRNLQHWRNASLPWRVRVPSLRPQLMTVKSNIPRYLQK